MNDESEDCLAEQKERLAAAMAESAAQIAVLNARCDALGLANQGFCRVEREMLKDRSANQCPRCMHASAFHSTAGRCLVCDRIMSASDAGGHVDRNASWACAHTATTDDQPASERQPVAITIGGATITVWWP